MDVEENETGIALNRLAREQMKHRLLKDLIIDFQVCKLENIDPKEYVTELKQLIDDIYRKVIGEA